MVTYLELLNSERYTRQRFRRSSITYFGLNKKKNWRLEILFIYWKYVKYTAPNNTIIHSILVSILDN